MTPPVAEIVGDWRWLPHRLDASGRQLQFIRLDRDDHRSVTFLEDQYFGGRFPTADVSVESVMRAMLNRATPRVDWIFHSSMALSTLMARIFDMPGISMGLKEPVILNQLAGMARQRKPILPLLNLVVGLLARPFAANERIVIKPGNVANILIPALMQATSGHALFVHAPLDDFVRSIANKGLPGRIAYRRLFRLLRGDFGIDGGFSDIDLFDQTDLQITALVWLNHHAQFAHLLPNLGGRAKSLSSRQFLADRRKALGEVMRFLDIPADPAAIEDSGVFDQHAKELGRPFDAASRAAAYEAIDRAFGEEIRMVTGWGEAVARHSRIPLDLPNALLGER